MALVHRDLHGKPWRVGTKEICLSARNVRCLHVLRGGGTSDNLDQLSGNDSLSGAVEENLVLVDHLAGVLRCVLQKGESVSAALAQNIRFGFKLTSMALRRADCSQA